jgi:hypothetical protein
MIDLELQNLNLSQKFLKLIERGYEEYSKEFRSEILRRMSIKIPYTISDRDLDVIHTLSCGAKLVSCPFTGNWRTTYNTAGREAYWLFNDNDVCIVAQFSEIVIPSLDSVFIFPDKDVIVYFGSISSIETVRRNVEILFESFSKAPKQACALMSSVSRQKVIGTVEMNAPHLGHFVWNVLSAWQHIVPNYGKFISFFVSNPDNRFIGNVTDLFPEFGHRKLYYINNDWELFKIAVDHNALLAFPRGNYITEPLSRRIITLAKRICPVKKQQAIIALRARCRILCLFGVRLGNRAWIEQQSGFASLASALCEQFGSVGFLIDGLSADTHMGWTHALMSLDEEISLAKTVAAQIEPIAPCLNLVGESIAESVLGTEACDFFVAAAGSAMAKYKWISNKPGIVISNSAVLDFENPLGWGVRVFEQYRDNVSRSIFIDKSSVSDVRVAQRDLPQHSDFHLEWKVIFDAILENQNLILPKREKP